MPSIKKSFCIPLLLLSLLLTGCQSQPKKAVAGATPPKHGVTLKLTDKNGREIRADKNVEWAMFKSLAATTLKSGDIKHTEDILDSMLDSAGQKPDRWHAMAQIVAALPQHKAAAWLDKLAEAAKNTRQAEIPLILSQLAAAMKDRQKSLELATWAMELDKNNPKIRFWHARLLELEKNTLQAQSEYQWLVTHYPDDSQYQEALANILRQQGELDAAENIYARLPQTRDVLFKRLLLAVQQQNKPRAESLFAQLKNTPINEKSSPEQADKQWYLQGEAAWLLDRKRDALNAYQHVTGGEHYVTARFRMAAILEQLGETPRALEILRLLQNHDSTTAAQAAVYRASWLDKTGQKNAAFDVLDHALRYQPKNIDLLYARGLLHERHDNLEAMERDLQAILAIDPDNATALNALGYSLADHNTKLEEARRYLEKALQLEPDNPAIIDSMGWLHYRLGNYSEAEKLIRKALALSGSDPEIYHHLITVLKAQGKASEASAVAKRAQAEFPSLEK